MYGIGFTVGGRAGEDDDQQESGQRAVAESRRRLAEAACDRLGQRERRRGRVDLGAHVTILPRCGTSTGETEDD